MMSDEYEEEEALYLCQETCFDGVALYEKGKKYAVDPKNEFTQKYFRVPKKRGKNSAEKTE